MGLPKAIEAHKGGRLEEAEYHYRRAYDQKQVNEILYQNFGAVLKKLGKLDQANLLYKEGISKFPNHSGIKRNYANLLRKQSPAYSIELYLDAISISLRDSSNLDFVCSCFEDLIDLLREIGLLHWSRALIRASLLLNYPSPCVLKNLLLILDKIDVPSEISQQLIISIESSLATSPLKDSVSLDFALAAHYLNDHQHDRSLFHFQRAIKRIDNSTSLENADFEELQKLVDVNSWNYACTLLPLQKFELGWSLFDYGLRTPAEGKQRWQRALAKPFSADDLPLWRGECIDKLRLLLLEEQAIGDGMMFLTLLPALLSETLCIGILLSPRLKPIYLRSFAQEILEKKIFIYTKDDIASGLLNASDYDMQSPLGSICQYRFKNIDLYSPRVPILKADQQLSQELRSSYLHHDKPVQRLVGVSWRGGGRGERIKQKSLNTQLFGELMLRHPGTRFIDLQYGQTINQVGIWQKQGIDIIHDKQIDPLNNMDRWLAQVQACDAVISVANTTIHGAGGLNIPTQCLLSLYSDWRWLADPQVMRSYWYPSVGIARERKDASSSWSNALELVSNWLNSGCLMPVGPTQPPMQ